MKYNIVFSKITPISEIQGKNAQEIDGLKKMSLIAREFLAGFEWCKEIEESYFGTGVSEIFAVFLFKIKPSKQDIDEWLWVVVGDLPSAYLVVDHAPDPTSALKIYIGEMDKWVSAIENGKSVKDLIPVNAPSTKKYAEMLKSRLRFLEEEILSD